MRVSATGQTKRRTGHRGVRARRDVVPGCSGKERKEAPLMSVFFVRSVRDFTFSFAGIYLCVY